MNSKFFSSGSYKKSKEINLKQGGFFLRGGMFADKKINFDIALNLVHGRDGEDGKIASLMTFFNIPVISPNIEASVLSYNKLYTKLFAANLGVNTLDYESISKGSKQIISTPYPFIVKPIHLGSSIGLSVVKNEDELDYALDTAFEFDSEVIIEPFINGVKEYNLAGCFTDKWELSIIEEPVKEELLNFDDKYLNFSRDDKVVEADINDELKEKMRTEFKKVYGTLFKGSLIRCDFFVVDNEVYLNEINPIPGSMANYLFDDFEGVIEKLSSSLYKENKIVIDYSYINEIQSAKGGKK